MNKNDSEKIPEELILMELRWVNAGERMPTDESEIYVLRRKINGKWNMTIAGLLKGYFVVVNQSKSLVPKEELRDFEWLDQQAPISGAATGRDIDWEKLEKEFWEDHPNGIYSLKIEELFSWIKSKLSSLPPAQGQFSKEQMRKCWDAARSIEDDLIRKGEFDNYLKQLHSLPDPKP